MRILKIIFLFITNPKLLFIRIKYNFNRFFSDVAAKFGKYKYKYNIIFIAGMPMSATTYVKNMFGLVPGYFTRYTPMPFEVADNQDISESAFKYCPKKCYTLFKTHLNPSNENLAIIKKNNVKKLILTYRDLRDVAVARYYRLKKIPRVKDPDHLDYNSLNLEEGLNHSISIVQKNYIPWIVNWLEIYEKNRDFVLPIKFENLVNNTEHELRKMLDFYEISLSDEKINEILIKTKGKGEMVKNMQDSSILPWAFSTNFRSGKIGSWKNEFNKNNVIQSKKLLGKCLIDLGYEKNQDW